MILFAHDVSGAFRIPDVEQRMSGYQTVLCHKRGNSVPHLSEFCDDLRVTTQAKQSLCCLKGLRHGVPQKTRQQKG